MCIRKSVGWLLCLLVACLTSQKHANEERKRERMWWTERKISISYLALLFGASSFQGNNEYNYQMKLGKQTRQAASPGIFMPGRHCQ